MSASAPSRTAAASRPRSEFFRHPAIAAALPFVNGGAAGMIATSFIQPVDMVKVRSPCGGTWRARYCGP